MKRIILLIAPFLLLSCANDESAGMTGTTQKTVDTTFNPPTWLHGVWTAETGNQQNSYSFVFNGDNICYSAANTNSVCWKEGVAQLTSDNISYNIDEQVTGTNYTVSYTANGVTTAVSFTKLADNKISVFVPEGADPYAEGTFVKQ